MTKSFVLEPKWQKCVTQVEFWRKGNSIIERAQLWRFGQVTVSAKSKTEISNSLKSRDEQDRICISDIFEFEDQTLRDCISDDIFFSEDMTEKESKRLKKLFDKDPEEMFEREKWSIDETKLYFESEILLKQDI